MSTSRSQFNPIRQWHEGSSTEGEFPRFGSEQFSSTGEHEPLNYQSSQLPRVLAALIGGTALTAFGVSRRSWPGVVVAAAGGFLMYYGVSRREAFKPVHVALSVTIDKPVEEVWNFWRNFENLPRFMTHLESVKTTNDRYSHWVARGPLGKISWHAEVTDEHPHEYIVWRSLSGSMVDHRGSVEFRPAPGNRGTEIHVALHVRPPVGRAGAALATMFGESPQQQIREDLRHLKQLLEAGEIPTTTGQPHGRRSLLVKAVRRMWINPRDREVMAMPRTA